MLLLFSDFEMLEIRRILPKNSLTFLCVQCNEAFVDHKSLAEHLSCHNNFQCEKCKEVCLDGSSYEDHMKNHHLETATSFKCNICEKCFDYKNALKIHLIKVHGRKINSSSTEKNHHCNQCPKTFVTNQGLKNHQTTCGKLFKCHLCGKTFMELKTLKIHIKVIHEKVKKS